MTTDRTSAGGRSRRAEPPGGANPGAVPPRPAAPPPPPPGPPPSAAAPRPAAGTGSGGTRGRAKSGSSGGGTRARRADAPAAQAQAAAPAEGYARGATMTTARPDAAAGHPQPGPATGANHSAQTGAARTASATRPVTPPARTRRARLKAARVDPWSVMKVSFLLSVALGVVTIVAVTILWMVLNGLGVFDSLGGTVKEVTQSETDPEGFDLKSTLSMKNTMVFSSAIAVIDVILVTALATLGAFLYNLTASFTGGIEVTLAEED
ncbi:DUF3566 domain-containing protein [Yinghuangia sp. YIM S09857]|uniref:DUF3566 domain-containing protein n=1 Tax=Yinghuangia sp. YIM S09857 TaxID=3436929 RepID=UPI003F52A6F7